MVEAAETEEKKKVKKKAKQAELKDFSMFDADAPNIFDDPLLQSPDPLSHEGGV